MNREQSRRRPSTAPASRADNVKNSSRKRKRSSNKRNGFVYLVLLLLVIAAGVGVSFTVIFNTEHIAVENPAIRYSDEDIIKASGITVGDNMPSMNVHHIEQSIEKQLPYIGKAHIKRRLDSTVTITVEYTRATLALPYASGYIILDSSGKVLEKGVAEPADYIAEIAGAEAEYAEPGEKAVFTDADMFTYVTGLASDFENAGYRNVTLLDFSDLQNIRAEIDYRVTVKLGSITKAASKLKFGKKVIDENLGNASSGRLIVDLTQDGTAFVRSEENIAAAQEALEKVKTEGETAENLSDPTELSSEPAENSSEPETEPEEAQASAQPSVEAVG